MKNNRPRRLVRFGFHLLYHELAFTYDAVAWLVSSQASFSSGRFPRSQSANESTLIKQLSGLRAGNDGKLAGLRR